MACEGKGTRYDVAKEILRICKRPDIKLTAVDSKFFKKEYFAPRPISEMMYNSNLRKLGLNYMRPWKKCLRNYIEKHFPDYIRRGKKRPVAVDKRPTIRIEEIKLRTKKIQDTGREKIVKEG